MKYYYLLVSDAIYTAKNGSYKHDWEFKIGYLLFVFMFLNINTIMILFDLHYSLFRFDILSHNTRFNGRFNAFLHTAPPIIMFNYYFIFYKNKYKQIEAKYPHSNKKLFITYFIISVVLGFGCFFLQKWVRGILIFWD